MHFHSVFPYKGGSYKFELMVYSVYDMKDFFSPHFEITS